jgi:hypothetical protein
VSINEFGLTNDVEELESVRRWVADAVADRWEIEPTYQSEPVESAATLTKDGFKVLALMRDRGEDRDVHYCCEAKVSAWGPDGLAIRVPRTYDFDLIQQSLRRCGECGADDVETQRVGFAGRVCESCLPAAQKKYEFDGWTR